MDTDVSDVERSVSRNTAEAQAAKVEEVALLATLNAQRDDLLAQLQAVTAKRDASAETLAGIEKSIDVERANFNPQYEAIADKKAAIESLKVETSNQESLFEAKSTALDTAWGQAVESHTSIHTNVETLLSKEDDHEDAIQSLRSALNDDVVALQADTQRKQVEQSLVDEQKTVAASLDEFMVANSVYTSEMGTLQGQIASVQKAIDQMEQELPTLDGQKKAAAATRNFKEAGKISKDIAALTETLGQKQAELKTMQETKAKKEADNEEANLQLVALQAEVTAKETAAAAKTFEHLNLRRAELQGRIDVSGEEGSDSSLLDSQLSLAAAEAEALAAKYGFDVVQTVNAVKPTRPPERARTAVKLPSLPKQVPPPSPFLPLRHHALISAV